MDKGELINPIFRESFVPVVFEVSRQYMPFLSVALESLMEVVSEKVNYDIIILGDDIDEESKTRLKKGMQDKKNISIRFFNPYFLVEEYITKSKYRYKNLNYYRLALPWILLNYDRVINLGADVLFNRDVADLFYTDISEESLAAGVIDFAYIGKLKEDIKPTEVGMKNPYRYMNADVMLLNLKEIRRRYIMDDLLDVWQQRYYRHEEQDIINLMFEDKITFLDERWNVFAPLLDTEANIQKAGNEIFNIWKKSAKEPYIIHFAGAPKPWNNVIGLWGETWEKYAKKSLFYDEICMVREKGHQQGIIKKLMPINSRSRKIIKRLIPFESKIWHILKRFDR